jgi:uncharacterized membrane protein YczE
MKSFLIRVVDLVMGIFLLSLGVVLTIKANIGYPPWEVLHVGLARTTGFSIGIASILAGLVIVIFVTACGEKIGLGTVLGVVLTGVFIDLIMTVIPTGENIAAGSIMLIIGLFFISLGTYFYMKSAFGAGPRDNLMVVLKRKTKLRIGVCRSIIELTAVLAGWLLGGMVGAGTVISVIAIGFFIQITFAIFKFDVTQVQHETLIQTYKTLINHKK